jgi:hypothetical protein
VTECAQKHNEYNRITTRTNQREKTKASTKRETILHPRETWQKTGKAFHAMDWISTERHTDLSCVHENAQDSIRRNNESDSKETDERDLQ